MFPNSPVIDPAGRSFSPSQARYSTPLGALVKPNADESRWLGIGFRGRVGGAVDS